MIIYVQGQGQSFPGWYALEPGFKGSREDFYAWTGNTSANTSGVQATTGGISSTVRWKEANGTEHTQALNVPAASDTVTYGGSGIFLWRDLPYFVMTFDGVNLTSVTGGGPPPWESPWKDREGDNVKVPIFREEDGPFRMKIGDKEYEFDAKEGVAWIDFKIPANWDGTATIDGQTVKLAGNMAYTGTPTMAQSAGKGTGTWLANPYGGLPRGMTPDTRQPTLPPGMTAGNTLPLPPGVSVGTISIQNGNVVTTTTTPSGSSTTVTSTNPSTNGTGGTVVNNSGGNYTDNSTTIVNNSNSGGSGDPDATDENGEGNGSAVDGIDFNGNNDVGLGSFNGNPGNTVISNTNSARSAMSNKLANFKVMANGSIPKSSTYQFSMNFGRFGTINKTINFEAAPFPMIRSALVAMLTVGFAIAFLKKITI